MPFGFVALVINESLAIELPIQMHQRGRQFHVVVDLCLVLSRTTDFDDFRLLGALEDPVANVWRLENAVTGLHDEWRALVFVHDLRSCAA